VTAIGSPPAGPLYDARRRVYYAKPVLRGWLHLFWFAASLVLGPLLLARAHGATQITAVAVYSVSVSALFGFSALYHRGSWTAVWRQRLQRLDHAMIFFLIAGTATPVFLLTARGTFGLVCDSHDEMSGTLTGRFPSPPRAAASWDWFTFVPGQCSSLRARRRRARTWRGWPS